MKKTTSVLILITLNICIFSFVELLAYLSYTPTRLDRILKIIEPKSEVFWAFRKNLNTVFFDGEVSIDNEGFRKGHDCNCEQDKNILVLGASPSFGWGVDDNQTYSYLLEQSTKYNVHNRSVIGYSSYQGQKILTSYFQKYKAKYVFISYVINDVDHFRFYFDNGKSDKDTKAEVNFISSLERLFNYSYTYKMIRKLIPVKSRVSSESREIRVSKRDYRLNLTRMIEQIRVAGGIPVLLKMPVNITEIALNKENYEDKQYLASLSSKLAKEYNLILEDVAKKEQVSMLDIRDEFNKHDQYLFVDKKIDTIHPNAKGHMVIADILIKYLKNHDKINL